MQFVKYLAEAKASIHFPNTGRLDMRNPNFLIVQCCPKIIHPLFRIKRVPWSLHTVSWHYPRSLLPIIENVVSFCMLFCSLSNTKKKKKKKKEDPSNQYDMYFETYDSICKISQRGSRWRQSPWSYTQESKNWQFLKCNHVKKLFVVRDSYFTYIVMKNIFSHLFY